MSRSPLFQVMFVLQNTPAVPEVELNGLQLEPQRFKHVVSMFDLTLLIKETADGLYGTIEYCSDLYGDQQIKRMTDHYTHLLRSLVKDPNQEIASLPMLTEMEQHQLLVEFNDTQVDYPKDKSIVDLFIEQVIQTPDKTAVSFEQCEICYSDLHHHSNKLAHYLKDKGIKKREACPSLYQPVNRYGYSNISHIENRRGVCTYRSRLS